MFERLFPERFRRVSRPYDQNLTERLTEQAGKVIVLAEGEAKHLNHNYLGTEHLLLGLLREDEGVAARALGSLNVTLDEVREQVEGIVGDGEGGQSSPLAFPFTPRSKKVLEVAESEALRLGYSYIGTEHILLGLVRESEGVAARVFSGLGVERSMVIWAVEAAINADQEEGSNSITIWAKIEKLEVHVHCGVSEEERALPQTLLVDLEYSYDARGRDDLSGVVDYGLMTIEVARILEREEFKLLETAAWMVGKHVLSTFPAVREISVSITKPGVPVARSLAGVSVSATFRR